MYTLGLNSILHDSAAVLVRDGQVVAAVEEERFSRIRHQKRPLAYEAYGLPYASIDYCLKEAGITLGDVDHVTYSFNPFLLLSPDGLKVDFALPGSPAQVPNWPHYHTWATVYMAAATSSYECLRDLPYPARSHVPYHLRARLGGETKFEFHYLDHHLCHAASAFLPSPFQKAAVMTLDGAGESASTTYGRGDGTGLEIFKQIHRPNSLGMLYEYVTRYLGFRGASHEYKVMAMASYARPVHADYFRSILQVVEGGGYVVNEHDFVKQFGPARVAGEALRTEHYEIAASLQLVLEETVLELVHWLHKETGEENLCMAGGVALNCVLNSVIAERGPFKEVWIQPAANDAGTALGGALWLDLHRRPDSARLYRMDQALLGPSYNDQEIEGFLKWAKVPYRKMNDVPAEVAQLLTEGNIVGWFQGRMEFGPRALGARSILASPVDPTMKDRLNEIKDREDFRPVAPAVLENKAGEWFEGARCSPFMLFTFPVRQDKLEAIPSVQHVDHSARIQTVRREQNPLYHDLLEAFEARTGVPILINTSFNSRGEPIVCSPQHALETFWATPLDALALGSFLLEKSPSKTLPLKEAGEELATAVG